MPRFSALSAERLATCHPELQVLFEEVVRGFDCVVLEGYRGEAKQEAAFTAGNTKLHFPHGKHNQRPSMAVDVAPSPLNWRDTQRFYFFAGYVLGVAAQLNLEHRVRFGGDWDSDTQVTDESFRDLVHFELRSKE